jgi:hypothetical protein
VKLFPLLFNLSFKVSLSLGLALSLSLSSPTLAQSDNGDLKSESESQATGSDDSMNTLWAESQESQKPKDSPKKSKPSSKSKTKKTDSPVEAKSDSSSSSPATSSTPIDLSPSSTKDSSLETKATNTPTAAPEATRDSDLSTPIMIQPAPAAMGETTVTDVSGLCSLSSFQNSDLLRTAAWPGVGPFTAESDNKFVDPQENKLKVHVDGDHVTACELLLNNQNGSKQSILNLEMTCDFMLEALGAKGNKISEFNTYFEKNKDKIATSKANSENQMKTSSGSYVIALAGGGQSASNSVLIQVTSKNKVLTDEQSLVSSISPAKTEPVDETPTVASTATTATTTSTRTTPIKSTPTKGITAKAGVTKTSTIKPATTAASNKPVAKPSKVETTETTPEAVKTEPQLAATKDPLRDELAGAIRTWQTIKKSALKDRNPAALSKILSGALLQRQTDSIKALTDSKHYYELTPKGVVVEKYTELSSSPQKYSVYAKVMELTKIMKDGATKPDKETDDTYSVNYTVERSGDHWTISNSLLLVKKK